MVRAAFTDWDDALLSCIWSRHLIGRPETVVGNVRRVTTDIAYGTEVTFQCPNCATLRIDVYDTKGDLNNRRYKHTPQYKAALKAVRQGKIKRPEITLEVLRRLRANHKKRMERKESRKGSSKRKLHVVRSA